MSAARYPRDLIGHGRVPRDPQWPGRGRVAMQLVVNYEAGGGCSILHGDPASEAFLSDAVGAVPWSGQRQGNLEFIYEYGSRAGFWRLWDLFKTHGLPVAVFGVARHWRSAQATLADKAPVLA